MILNLENKRGLGMKYTIANREYIGEIFYFYFPENDELIFKKIILTLSEIIKAMENESISRY